MIQGREVAAVIVGAGRSSRMGFDKLFYPIDGVEVFRHTVARFDEHPEVDRIIIVAGQNMSRVRSLFDAHPARKPLTIVEGGETRAASVSAGVAACFDASLVAIHDAARPFVSADVISRALFAAAQVGAAAPALEVKDTVKRVEGELVTGTENRDDLRLVQTPQVFDRAAFARAFAAIPIEDYPTLTDDCMVMERAGLPVRLVKGEVANRKITTLEDLRDGVERKPAGQPRVGHGYDVHRLEKGRRLVLGGVDIPYKLGLLGHSDADVVLHAVADAILGAAALGDIGRHFPDTDEAYRDASSMALLGQVRRMAEKAGFWPANLDVTVVCQQPKLAPYMEAMKMNIAEAVGLALDAVNIKATTEEGLGFTGSGQGIAAHCVALVEKRVP